jgi:hypothetical protein
MHQSSNYLLDDRIQSSRAWTTRSFCMASLSMSHPIVKGLDDKLSSVAWPIVYYFCNFQNGCIICEKKNNNNILKNSSSTILYL